MLLTHNRAVIIVLYRPFILDTPQQFPPAEYQTWRSLACHKTRLAATVASNAVMSLLSEDLISLSHTTT